VPVRPPLIGTYTSPILRTGHFGWWRPAATFASRPETAWGVKKLRFLLTTRSVLELFMDMWGTGGSEWSRILLGTSVDVTDKSHTANPVCSI
jgi:hypothetical protein